MATNQDTNRRSLYDIIKNEFVSTKTDKIFTYDQWFNLFFKDANTLSDQSSTGDKKGKTKYNNLYSIINFKKILNGDETIIKYYFQPSVKNSTTWKKRLTTKQEFYKTFACDLPWAKSLNFCKGQNINKKIDDIVGDYTTDNKLIKNFKIRKLKDTDDVDKDAFYITSIDLEKIPGLSNFTLSKLVPTSDPNVFSISSLKLGETLEKVITINDKGFVLSYIGFVINATKVVESSVKNTESPEDKKKKTDTVITKKTDDKKSDIPYVKTTTVTFDKTPEDKTPTKQCSDFPFELGCVNPKIGDFNAATFRGNRFNDAYTTTVQTFLDGHRWFTKDNPNKELTQDIWNKFMNKSVIKESIKKVLKEYINKKK
jgi:hypothetical protein